MRAVRLHAFGPAENLTYEQAGTPVPGSGQVRIAVGAAGVHMIDTVFRQGDPKSPYPLPELPTIPGREVAGTVDALGEGTDPRWLGRRVAAHLGMVPGGYAETAVTDAGKLHELPENLDFAQAIAMIGTGRTTLGILRFADLTDQDVVIVTAAAGGIGTLLVQHAGNVGATVVGAAGGPAKVERVRDLGADVAVDYNADDWTDQVRTALGGRSATVVFDAVSGPYGRAAVDLLGKGGKHLVYGWSGGGPLALGEEELATRGITSQTVVGPAMMKAIGGPEGLRALEEAALAEAAAGRLVPAVQRFPLAEAAAAHRALESRATMGKVILVP
ncbi:zinc-binding dehydrogenase [Streptomyces sp. SPB162]|uniref:zinc-binding dehydrogenase n=1 Tax=Streptomyces sp. SPB162 TaxID=2940560 RepID=UPI0024059ED5|nr:zinc-binding dehydrogenase [Streptomyces sp. SPB162]MDF9814799.1 NADPH2:quinone reductase [Streptomyces sp. SPB162]